MRAFYFKDRHEKRYDAMQMNFHRKLPIPKEVKAEFPLTERMEEDKAARDEAIRAVFEGRSDKFILVIGPCSAEHRDPVLDIEH